VKLAIGCDHGGFALKTHLLTFLREKSIELSDEGSHDDSSVDYPDYAAKVAKKVSTKEVDGGILICGTGIGMCIAANKFDGVRAAVLTDENAAKLAKAHNNANVICLGGRVLKAAQAKELISIWLETPFGGDRHERRLAKIAKLDVQ
jgi:ribose 5-phosphate isomerase B